MFYTYTHTYTYVCNIDFSYFDQDGKTALDLATSNGFKDWLVTIYILVHIHSCMHAYIYTYILTCKYSYIYTMPFRLLHESMTHIIFNALLTSTLLLLLLHNLLCMYTYIFVYIYTYIHTYINIYMYVFVCICIACSNSK